MRECPTCHEQTPDGVFCVRCGAPLDGGLEHARSRRQFAVAPGERRYAPWLISTLFPHLPRHSDRHFRVALGAAAVLVIVLGALRLFPIALIAAAAMMPLLTILYFYDVDIYEGEPAWATAWSLGWGLVTGVGAGLVAKALAPTGPALFDRGSTGHVLTGGVLIPAAGVLVMLVGPIALLGYRRFDETLDGATFGAATASTFAAAEAVVVGVDILRGGVHPGGAAIPWIVRLIALGVATPVLSMSAVGAAAAALWLRHRAPLKDRRALGPQGVPALAILAALTLVAAGAIGETFMAVGVWLAWLIVLDVIGLMLLRRALHVGLLEEAQELEIGPVFTCANCGVRTARHSFCGHCGIALKALPKGAGRERSARRRLIPYAAMLAASVAIAFVVAALAAPGAVKPRCRPHFPCGAPPLAPRVLTTFPGYTRWQSSSLGYALRYNSNDWQAASQSANSVDLGNSRDGFSEVLVTGVPASQASPAAAVASLINSVKGQLLGLTADTSPSNQLLGPQVGLIAGEGGAYTATLDSPQGPQAPVAIAVMAATDGKVTVAVVVKAPSDNQSDRAAVFRQADDLIDSIEWPGR